MSRALILTITTLLISGFAMNNQNAQSQDFTPNYDESKVPDYTLPQLLVCEDGTPVDSVADWERKRRGELLNLFETHVYGKTPGHSYSLEYEVETASDALNGMAIRKQVALYPFGKEDGYRIEMLMYLPKSEDPVPCFIGLNFKGNHTIDPDPDIWVSEAWKTEMKRSSPETLNDIDATRGDRINRWPAESIVKSGYGLATIYYYDIDPDYHDEFQNGIHPYFYKEGQTKPEPDEWGSIGAWSWGLSRALDYLEADKDIDNDQIVLMGHSRLGKTSLWAGALDPRFDIVISNDSGCGGAALSRRAFGETVGRINRSFPHWFNDNFNQYNENESALPVDQHQLIALMAPRPVYVASAEDDRWADPKGEFLSAMHAGAVYELYGLKGVEVDEQPPVNSPVGGHVGYHVRTGKHDVTEYDWQQYINFADRHFKR